MTERPAMRRNERGATSVLALALLIGVSLILASLLTYTGAAVRSATGTADRVGRANDASAATDYALANLTKSGYYNNPTDQQCSAPFFYQAPNESNALVYYATKCTPKTDSGALASSFSTNGNSPTNALVLLGSEGRDGLNKRGNAPLYVKGGVVTNSDLSFPSAGGCSLAENTPTATNVPPPRNCNELYVERGGITAATPSSDCDQTSPTYPTKVFAAGSAVISCGNGGTPAVRPSTYTLPDTSLSALTYRKVASCSNGQTYYQFAPGYYDDVNALNAVTNPGGSGACKSLKNVYFAPGVYYFDFKNLEYPFLSNGNGQDLIWKMDFQGGNNSVPSIIGGAPLGWTVPSPFNATPPAPLNAPLDVAGTTQGCVDPKGVDPTTNAKADGVVFVFGGESRVQVGNANLELCAAAPSTSNPPVVLYGAESGSTPGPVSVTASADAVPTTSSGGGAPSFTNLPGATLSLADTNAASVSFTNKKSSTLTEDAFAPASAVRQGRLVQPNFALNIVQKSTVNTAFDYSADITVKPGSGVTGGVSATFTASGTVAGNATGTWATTNILTGLSAADLVAMQKQIKDNGFGGLTVAYTVTNRINGNLKVDVDQMALVLSVSPPSVRSQGTAIRGTTRNCVGDPASSDTPCPLMSSLQGAQPQVFLKGMTFAPLAGFTIDVNNVSGQVFGWGLVADWLDINVTASNFPNSSAAGGPMIEVPFPTQAGADAVVYLRTYRCTLPSAGATPAAWTGETPSSECGSGSLAPVLKAEAWLQSPTDATALGRRRLVRIASWDQRP